MLRMLSLAGALTGAAALSQFPEFSQQYVQRLGGAVDALSDVVADFDASADAEGLSRADALAQMVGSDFVERRRADMERTFERHATLSMQLQDMQQAGPFMRAYHTTGLDTDVARAAYAAYKPAVPLTLPGAIFAVFGAISGYGVVGFLASLIRAPFRRNA
jgi:hypothetical protein